jgi:hypothetical protein
MRTWNLPGTPLHIHILHRLLLWLTLTYILISSFLVLFSNVYELVLVQLEFHFIPRIPGATYYLQSSIHPYAPWELVFTNLHVTSKYRFYLSLGLFNDALSTALLMWGSNISRIIMNGESEKTRNETIVACVKIPWCLVGVLCPLLLSFSVMTLFSSGWCVVWMRKYVMIMNYELTRTWNKAVMACYPSSFMKRQRETIRDICNRIYYLC